MLLIRVDNYAREVSRSPLGVETPLKMLIHIDLYH